MQQKGQGMGRPQKGAKGGKGRIFDVNDYVNNIA